jgi:hypothetical protein
MSEQFDVPEKEEELKKGRKVVYRKFSNKLRRRKILSLSSTWLTD